MYIKRYLEEIISRLGNKNNPIKEFIYPYSEDPIIKREQIWSNLQRGILFEDTQTYILWDTPFNFTNKYKEKRIDQGDRTLWHFGERTILDGYKSNLQVFKFLTWPWTNPIERASEFLGFEKEGHKKILALIEHLTNLFGEPSIVDIEYENENFCEGCYIWTNSGIEISVTGFEMHAARYNLNIGLIKDTNLEYDKKAIEELKATGLTENELGK